jgi:hypothetical protein
LKRFDVLPSTANSNKYLLQKANVQRHLFIRVVMFNNLTVELKKTLFFSPPQKISIVLIVDRSSLEMPDAGQRAITAIPT